MNEKKLLYTRSAFVALLLVALGGIFLWLCYDATVVNAIDPTTSSAVNSVTASTTIQASRGNITDRYGRLLVTNKAEYVVTLNVDEMGDVDQQVQTILWLMELCKKSDIEWNENEIPVSSSAPYHYVSRDSSGKETKLKNIRSAYESRNEDGTITETRLSRLCARILNTDKFFWGSVYIDADHFIKNMSTYFRLDQLNLLEKEKRQLLGVLYSCYLRQGASDRVLWTDYYFAEDVDIDFITQVKEAQRPGVDIIPVSVRDYKTPYAAHLLGQVGPISAEKWEELKQNPDNTYNMNNSIGLSGVEAAFESYLRGVDGKEKVIRDPSGNLSKLYDPAPQIGNNVALTLDIDLQQAAEEALEEWTYKLNDKQGGSAAVVINVKDSSILACASYPTFNAATYSEDYKELSEDSLLPLLNRALLGIYAPGSTYKICTGTASISTGVNDLSRTINCTGRYNNHGTYQKCWKTSGHGYDDLSDAIRDSCNVYFYTMGTEIGIERLNKVARDYGLGVHTGVELAEAVGVNAGPEFAESIGGTWYSGNVTSAAIGQSDNQFTPLQLASYIATFVRGGVRYDAHLLKNVKSSDNSELIYEHESEILSTVDLPDAVRKEITIGMGQVIEIDKIPYFKDLEASGIKVGCKTGTAELGKTKRYNAMFVAFAPIEDPEIVVCTAVEKGGYGADSSGIAAQIMEYYFSEEATLERINAENQLIS